MPATKNQKAFFAKLRAQGGYESDPADRKTRRGTRLLTRTRKSRRKRGLAANRKRAVTLPQRGVTENGTRRKTRGITGTGGRGGLSSGTTVKKSGSKKVTKRTTMGDRGRQLTATRTTQTRRTKRKPTTATKKNTKVVKTRKNTGINKTRKTSKPVINARTGKVTGRKTRTSKTNVQRKKKKS